MAPHSILVLGIGELGSGVLHGLLDHPSKHGTRIAILKRTSVGEEVESFKAQGVEILIADVATEPESSLAEIFGKFHTVISCNGMTLPPSAQTKLARVAIQSGVKRFFPWQFGGDYDAIGRNSSQELFDVQLDVRALLRGQSTVEWVILSTGMFTSFLFEPFFGVLDADRTQITALGSWENKITVTSARDIGRITAEIALACPEVRGVVYGASDTISMKRLADLIDEVLQRRLDRKVKTVAQLKEELDASPDDVMKKYQIIFGEGVGVSWDKTTTFNAEHGIETEDVETWAKMNLR